MKLLCTLFLIALLGCKPQPAISNPPNEKGFAVVELFTSEGCSSCPPADKLLQDIAKEYDGKEVLVLAYHVDYWDRLGWKDKFSSAANTQRQQQYSSLLRLDNVYTPQAVVNGTTEFVGSNKSKMESAIMACKTPQTEIAVTAKFNDGGTISVNYKSSKNDKSDNYVVALVEKEALTNVKGGENGGRQLKHINIVRQFDIVKNNSGDIQFKLPEQTKDNYFVAVLDQNAKTGMIEGYQIASIE